MSLKRWIKRKILGPKADPQSYVQYLRSLGVAVGERTTIYEPSSVCIDVTRPFLLTIGDDVKITRGVTILTHGYDWSVLAGTRDVVLGSSGAVTIGNNVFIGMNATILKGVTIGDNTIVAAGSLVTKDAPGDCVIVGSPARVVCSLDEYYEKRLKAQKTEAFELYAKYVERMGREPSQDLFDEFFFLFQRRQDPLPASFKRQMGWKGRFEETLRRLQENEPEFDGFDAFLAAAREAAKK